MLKIFRPIRPVTAGMNGIVLLLLLPVLLYAIFRIGVILFPGAPEWEMNLGKGILPGGAVLYLYGVYSLMVYSCAILRAGQPDGKLPVWRRLGLFLLLLLPAGNAVVFVFGILEALRRREGTADRTKRFIRGAQLFVLVSIGLFCCPWTALFRLLTLLSVLVLCRFLYRAIQSSAAAEEETGTTVFATIFCAVTFFLFCTVATADALMLHAAGKLQRAIALQAGAEAYSAEALEKLYRERCPAVDPEFDQQMRSPKHGDDLFERYPDLTLRPPTGVMSIRQMPEIRRFLAAHEPFLRRIDAWSAYPELGLNVAIRTRHTMDERNVFLNWSRFHMLRLELALTAKDMKSALHFWGLLRNVRNFIRAIPDQISDFTAASMEPMRIRLWEEMRKTFSFSPEELEKFRKEFADDRKEYEQNRKIILFRECFELYPPERTAWKQYLFPSSAGIRASDLAVLKEILQTMKDPQTKPASASGKTEAFKTTRLRKQLPSLNPATEQKRSENLSVLSMAEQTAPRGTNAE